MRMKRTSSQSGIVSTALLIIVILAFITGGIYLYSKTTQNDKDQQLLRLAEANLRNKRAPRTAVELYAELAWEKAKLELETTKLEELQQLAVTAAINNAYDGVGDFLNSSKIRVTDKELQARINAIRDEIAKILAQWKLLSRSGTGSGSAFQEAVRRDLPQVNNYIDELRNIVNSLTPENSGLTQAQIDEYKKAIDDTSGSVNDATGDLAVADTIVSSVTGTGNTGNSNTGTTTTPLPPNVQQQQEVVKQAQQDVDNTQNEINNLPPATTGGGTNTGGGSSGGYTGGGGRPTIFYYQSADPRTDTIIKSTSGEIIYPPDPAPVRNVRTTSGPSLIDGDY